MDVYGYGLARFSISAKSGESCPLIADGGGSVVIFRGVYGLAGLAPPIVGKDYVGSVAIRDLVRGVRFKCVIMIDVRATA